MYAKYKLKNEKKIVVFLWSDIINGHYCRQTTLCYPVIEGETIDRSNGLEVIIQKTEDGKLFFEYNNEKIMFEEFEFMTVDQLIEKLSLIEDEWQISEDDFLATFLKDTDNVGLIDELYEYDKIAKQFGIGMTGSKKKEMLCVPTEKKYKKSDWGYRVTLEAADESLRTDYAYEPYYFSDLVSLIKRYGQIELVNRNTYELTQSESVQKKKVR